MTKDNSGLVRRVEPMQKRAKDSVETILATTAELLDEVGVEAFNTNLLAARAKLRIRTIYRYFPNKYAVIYALTEKLAVDWDRSMMDTYRRLADPSSDWRRALKGARGGWLAEFRRVPGALSVLQAINATPELNELHFRIFEDMSLKTAAALKERGLRLPPKRLLTVARTLINEINTGMDLYLRLSKDDARLFSAELHTSLVAYLERYLPNPGTGRRKR
jgi:AcrR family transcriptional regulator